MGRACYLEIDQLVSQRNVMILEGILTTTGADGRPHVAPMGAVIADPREQPIERMVLRPWKTSATCCNLSRAGEAVFHVTDDVGLLACAAVGRLERLPELRRAESVAGWIIADACRWYALRVWQIDDTRDRAEVQTDVVDRGRIRDFFGFNRAMHAVVEGAICASRIGLLPPGQIRSDLRRLADLVEKTGGRREIEAWRFLTEYVREKLEETG
jgi:hypothetical protein